jgi:beta-phosphoglucomutase-like phosphatase (HAD superfamily)
VLAAKAASMACVAVPEPGERHDPAFALADLVVVSLLDVDAGSLDAVARGHFGGSGGGVGGLGGEPG